MNYRLAKLIKGYFPGIAIALLIVSGIGAFWLYQNFQPRYTTLQQTETIYAYEGSFDHWARVSEPNLLWPVGSILEERETYFLTVSPLIKSRFDFRWESENAVEGTALCNAALITLTSKNDEVYWMERSPLSSSVWDLSENISVLEIPELNVSRIKERIDNIQRDIQFSDGTTQIKVLVEVFLNGKINDSRIEKEETYEMPIDVSRSSYRVDSDLSREVEVTETFETEVKTESSITSKLLPILLLVAPLGGLGYVTFEKERSNGVDLQKLEQEQERNRYSDWISKGKLPDYKFNAKVPVESLEDLVNLAVDTNGRIIYDSEKSVYFLIEDNALYINEEQ